MGRFDKSDDEWLDGLKGQEVQDALARGEQPDPDLLPRCRAKGPGAVVCTLHVDHEGDHEGEIRKAGQFGSMFQELGRTKSRHRRRVRHISAGEKVRWPRQCAAISPATRVECMLPAGHPGAHRTSDVTWDVES